MESGHTEARPGCRIQLAFRGNSPFAWVTTSEPFSNRRSGSVQGHLDTEELGFVAVAQNLSQGQADDFVGAVIGQHRGGGVDRLPGDEVVTEFGGVSEAGGGGVFSAGEESPFVGSGWRRLEWPVV